MVIQRKPAPIHPSPLTPGSDQGSGLRSAPISASMSSPYGRATGDEGGSSSPYAAPTSPYAEYANYADTHEYEHEAGTSAPAPYEADRPLRGGHAAELSNSFYNEAAAALAGPVSPSSYAPSAPQAQAPALQANLTSLLQSPYAIHAQHSSTPNPFEETHHQQQQQHVPMQPNVSPGSMYDDKTEVDHTPMPALGYAYTPQPGPFADSHAQLDREAEMDGRGYAGGYDYAHAGPYDQVSGGATGGGGGYGEKGDDYAGSDYEYGEERDADVDLKGDEERGMMRHALNYDSAGYGDEHEAEGMAPAETMHFGPAPARGAQLRRNKTRKAVKLTQGNLVLDCPVPTKLQSFLTRRGEEEFTTMRYTAVTCDPDDFATQHFNLRPAMYNRHTEIHIAVTMYNEDEILFTRTLHGVMKNIAHLCSRHKSRTWGAEGWKKVVVTIIADGRKKIHPRVLDCLAALGVYQEGVAKNAVNGKQVQAHVYEYTTQLSIDSNLQFKGAERGLVPTQLIFCMKEHNQKKINSHRWFFNAFGPVLQPNVCILLDVGTRPEAKSIYYLWKTFDLNSNVAGACGEIQADTRGRWGLGPALLNPLVAAQNFEYKISNILDKTTESVFGFISVLPGAFSAYRYIALQNDELGRGPLASYFKGETMKQAEVTFSHANMYLAEDRILCFELAAKRNDRWVLRYVKSAKGVTDVPDSLAELISQRRRWLNGSFFAAIYSMTHTLQFGESGHGFWRKCCLYAEALYSTVNLIFAWLSLGNFYIFFRLLTSSLESKEFGLKGIGILNTGAQYVYLGTTIGCFILALGNRPQGSPWKFFAAAVIYAVLTLYMMVAAVLCLVKAVKNSQHDAIYSQMVFSVLATYGVYLLSSIIALDPLHLVTSFVQYLLLAPSYVNILNTYAFANLHDFSWGTKGISADSNDLGAVVATSKGTVEVVLPTAQADIDLVYDKALGNLRTRPMIIRGDASAEAKAEVRLDFFRDLRTSVLLLWSLSNGVLAAFILGGDNVGTFDTGSGTTRSKVYMIVVLVFIGAMSVVRFGMSTIFMIHRLLVG